MRRRQAAEEIAAKREEHAARSGAATTLQAALRGKRARVALRQWLLNVTAPLEFITADDAVEVRGSGGVREW